MNDTLAAVFTGPPAARAAADACPPSVAIADVARGAADPATARALAVHAAACTACAVAWSVAREIAAAELRAAGAPATRGAERRAARVLLAAAAVLALAVLVPVTLRAPAAPPLMRRAEAIDIVPSTAPGTPLPSGDFRLRWSGAPQGSRFEVRVFDSRLDRIAGARGLADPEYVVPPDAVARIPAGGRLLWQVIATLPDGRRVVSETFVTPRE